MMWQILLFIGRWSPARGSDGSIFNTMCFQFVLMETNYPERWGLVLGGHNKSFFVFWWVFFIVLLVGRSLVFVCLAFSKITR